MFGRKEQPEIEGPKPGSFEHKLATASDRELEELEAAGPAAEKVTLIRYELRRRRDARHERTASHTKWTGYAAALAAIASALVAVIQVFGDRDTSAAEIEAERRDLVFLQRDCHEAASDVMMIASSLRVELPESPTDRQQFVFEEIEDLKNSSNELEINSWDRYVEALSALEMRSELSLSEVERQRTEAVVCLESAKALEQMLADYEAETGMW